MNKQKELWEKLAKENPKYYINSDYGKGITEEEFSISGYQDVEELIDNDPLIPKLKGVCLDIGCGTGRMTEFMFDLFDKVIGIDISSEMIKQGKERLKDYDTIDLLETDGEHIPLEDNSVDFAFSYLVFQHMKTVEMINNNFKEVYRVLKPNGLFKVRVRTKMDKHENAWYSGSIWDEKFVLSLGFTILKKEEVKDYAVWLWLQKE